MSKLDAVAKRQIAAAVFLVIQAIKLHQILFPKGSLFSWHSSESLFFQWTLIDILFVVILHFLKIPKMSLSSLMTAVTCFAFCLLNAGLIGRIVEKYHASSSMSSRITPDYSNVIYKKESIIPSTGETFHEKPQAIDGRYHSSSASMDASVKSQKDSSFSQKVGAGGEPPTKGEKSNLPSADSSTPSRKSSQLEQQDQSLAPPSAPYVDEVDDADEESEYIQGSFTVHLVAPAVVSLNPQNTKHCLLDGSKLEIALSITGQGPWTLSLDHVNFQGKVTSLPDQIIHKNEDGTVPGIQVTQIGIYKVRRIMDHLRNIEGKIKDNFSQIVISFCPIAQFAMEEPTLHRCENEESPNIPILIEAKGISPFTVEYSVTFGNEFNPARYQLSLGQGAQEGDEEKKLVHKTELYKTILSLQHVGIHDVKLERIMDQLGNEVDLSKGPHTQYSVNIHALPMTKLRLGKDRHDRHFKLKQKETQEFLDVQIPLKLSGVGPWNVTFEEKKSHVKTSILFENSETYLMTSVPGEYKIAEVSDKYCRRTFNTITDSTSTSTTKDENIEFWIDKVDPPQLQVHQMEQQVTSCLGTSLANGDLLVNMELKGSAPFWVNYEVVHVETGTKTQSNVSIPSRNQQLRITPKESGKFIYKFLLVGDEDYPGGVTVSDRQFELVVNPKSGASFAVNASQDHVDATICKQDKTTFPVQFKGAKPLNLSYSIIQESSNSQTDYILNNVVEDIVDLELDSFDTAGKYKIKLNELTDGHGCVWSLDSQVQVQVLSSRPTADVHTKSPLYSKEGELADIQLELKGNAPYHVIYQHLDSKAEFTLDTDEIQPTLSLKKSGAYVILSVNDRYCFGEILEPSQWTIKKIPKPSVEISQELLSTTPYVCQDDILDLDIGFKGGAPFKATMSLHADQYPTSKKIIHSTELQNSISLNTNLTGQHWIQLNDISDRHYQDVILESPVLYKYSVYPRPTISVIDKELHHQCLSDKNSEGVDDTNSKNIVQFSLAGQLPFHVELDVVDEHGKVHEHVVFENLESKQFNLKIPSFNHTGVYSIYLQSLKDGYGCMTKSTFSQKRLVNIHVTENAHISALVASPNMCTGDRLTYSLQGSGPFQIETKFTNHLTQMTTSKVTQVQDPILTMLARKPGRVEIVQVCDRFGCCSKPENLGSLIHHLPKVKVAGGKRLEKDLREGDHTEMEINLEGIPPFTVTMAKRSLSSKSEEIFKIEDIKKHKHLISVAEEGEFQIKAIQDKYCSYPSIHHKSKQHKVANVFAE